MKIAKKALSAFAIVLISVGVLSPVAQAQAERIVAPEEQNAYVQEFYQDSGVTPVVDGSGGLSDAEIEAFHQAVRDAQQAGPLNDEIIAGQMLSDRIVLPPQVDKTTADEAEVAVAKQQAQPQMLASRAATCQRFIFTSYDVCGAILQRYNQLGNLLSFLLDPIGPQIQNPDGVGFHQQFRNGFIFWHPDTGAHAIATRNAEVYQRNGWSAGWMGYPLGGEVPVTGSNPIDGELNGWVQLFQGGRIYRTPVLEGFQVASINGLILDKWLELGGPDSYLGLPIADEATTPDGVGRYSIFQNGVIYWHPQHGAHSVSGTILNTWASQGYETGPLGYPIASAVQVEGIWYEQQFETGAVSGAAYVTKEAYWPIRTGVSSMQARQAQDKDIPGHNYESHVLPCIEYMLDESYRLAVFNVEGRGEVYLTCKQLRNHMNPNPYVATDPGHFYNYPLTRDEWYDFMACTFHTFAAEEYPNPKNDNWGRQRYNTYTGIKSVAIANSSNYFVTGWAGNTEHSAEWSGCAKGLTKPWR